MSRVEAEVAVSDDSRSSAEPWWRSWSTSTNASHTPSVPSRATGPCEPFTASTPTSAVTPARKASTMPCRAGHMPFSRNQPAAVTASSTTSSTARAGRPTAAPPAISRPSAAVSAAGCTPGGMIGDPVRRGGA